MTHRRFYIQLVTVSIITFILMSLLCMTETLKPFYGVAIGSIILFIIIGIVVYHLGYNSANSSNKHSFTTVIIGFIFGKMFLSILFLFGYYRTFQPESKYFLVPFFLVYLIYTVFETVVMTKLARIPSVEKS